MNGEHTCATCKYFKSLGYMSKEERQIFFGLIEYLKVDPEDYGLCFRFPNKIKLVRKDDGKNCKYWEV